MPNREALTDSLVRAMVELGLADVRLHEQVLREEELLLLNHSQATSACFFSSMDLVKVHIILPLSALICSLLCPLTSISSLS